MSQFQMLLRALLCVIICCFHFSGIRGQSPYLINYSTSDGLTSNECYDLIQDPKGFIWVAGDHGVARFDGTNFKNYSAKDGLVDNLITGLYLDLEGNIWCNSFRNGIMSIREEKVFVPEWADHMEGTGNHFDDLIETPDGAFHVSVQSTADSAHYFTFAHIGPNDSVTFEYWPIDSSSHIQCISNGVHNAYSLYTSTREEKPLCVDLGDRVFSTDPIRFPGPISDAVLSPSGDLFVAAEHVLYQINETGVEKYTFHGRILNSLQVDHAGGLWVGTSEYGAYHFPQGKLNAPPQRFLQDQSVTSVIEDDENGIWFSTIESGIYFMPYRSIKLWNEHNGLPTGRIIHSLICDSTLWLGFRNGTLTRTNLRQPLSFEVVQDYRYIFDMTCTEENELIIGVQNENTHQAGVREARAYSAFRILADGSVLGSPPSGRVQRTRNDSILWESSKDKRIPRMFVMCPNPSDGSIWMGGSGGLYRYEHDRISSLAHLHPLMRNRISDIAFYRDLTLIGLHGFGLLILSPTDTMHLHGENGLQSDFINAIHVRHDTVWLATSNGIDLIDLRSVTNPNVQHIGTDMGLPSPTVSDVQFMDGALWAMTDEGIAVLPTQDLLYQREAPNLYLKFIAVNGIRIDRHDQLELAANENNISIGFQAITYRNARAQHYYYRFANDPSVPWSILKGNQLDLANLRPGSYRLEIKTDMGDVPPQAVLPISFRIMTPFWARWYTLLAFSLIIVIATLFMFRNRVRVIRKAAMVDRRLNALNYRALKAQMNPHFIYNALNAIQHFIMQEQTTKSVKYLGGFSKLIRLNFENSSRDFVPVEDELQSLQLYFALEDIRYPNRFEYRVTQRGRLDHIHIPPMIIQPFIENAILHGVLPQRKPGIITLELTPNESHMKVHIEDNGIGIKAGKAIRDKKRKMLKSVANHDRESAMKVTKERILQLANQHRLDARYSVVDKSDFSETGTIISFNLPVHIPV